MTSTPTQIAPATPITDAEIAKMEEFIDRTPATECGITIEALSGLIARIKAERDANEVWEARMQSVLETNSAIREQTILECELIARNLGRDIVADSIAALLFPKDGGK